MEQKDKEIITKYLNSHKNEHPELDREFARLFCDNNKEANIKNLLAGDWENMPVNAASEKDLDHLLQRINELINSEKTQQLNIKHHRAKTIYTWYSRIAAILLLPLIVWSGYQLYTTETTNPASIAVKSRVQVHAPLGSRIHVNLPDGSIGWLNSGSVLEYEVPFEQRKLTVRGEAFFDIIHDSLRPLTVEGPHSFVKVYGTKFNVKMWPDEMITEVVLAEGSVEMSPKNSEESYKMQPGDMFVYDIVENKLIKKSVNPSYYSAWIEGKLVLRNVNLSQMARELSRWFNVDVEIKGASLEDHVFRATFEDEKLEEVLRLLKMTAPIEYKIIDNRQKSNGDFAKKKVIITHHEN